MSKGKIKILQANHKTIILETMIGTDYRFTIPKQIRELLKPNDKTKITIEKL